MTTQQAAELNRKTDRVCGMAYLANNPCDAVKGHQASVEALAALLAATDLSHKEIGRVYESLNALGVKLGTNNDPRLVEWGMYVGDTVRELDEHTDMRYL